MARFEVGGRDVDVGGVVLRTYGYSGFGGIFGEGGGGGQSKQRR
jgi:hypothetical protein